MARIFRKAYHEISNSWDFKNLIRNIDDKSIKYFIQNDQDHLFIITFYYSTVKENKVQAKKHMFLYERSTDEIVNYQEKFINETEKAFYYKYIEYAYHHLTTDEIGKTELTIFSKKSCKDNEFIQNQYQNIYYQIEGFYGKENVIKIYFCRMSNEIFTKLLSCISTLPEIGDKNTSLDEWKENACKQERIFTFFPSDELYFIKILNILKRSVGTKMNYISIQRDALVRLIPYIKNIQNKFYIFETGERLIFANQPLSLNFFISQIDPYNFHLQLAESHQIDQYFISIATYFLIKNEMFRVDLPFTDETIMKIIDRQLMIKRTELAYYKAIVSRQLSLFHHYLDFDERIEFPPIAEDIPKVFIRFGKDKDNLIINSYLEYHDQSQLPLKAVKLKENLIKLRFIDHEKWFYLPDELINEVTDLTEKLHLLDETDTSFQDYQWIISSTEEINFIKNNFLDNVNQKWHIVIADELKKEFVQTIQLMPEITIQKDENIDWFSYEITYKFNDLVITQEMLRKFFDTGKKLFVSPDGTNLRFENRAIFQEIEELIHFNKKDADFYNKMSLYRLPWIYELKKINPAINIYGDKYLDEMYGTLQKRRLPVTPQPHYSLKPVMRSYQRAGYEWLKMLEKFRLNGILADDMGLGKTLQAISVLTDLSSDSKSLIVCPKTLLFNWVAEIEKFNPQLKYYIHEGTKEERVRLLKTIPVQIILCSYNLIQNDLDVFKGIQFDYLILDEAQHIKNHTTLRAKAIKKIGARHKLAMTGTPLENSIEELWSVFDFLMPGYLPSIKKFRDFLVEKENNQKQTDRVIQYISPFILRRKKEEVLIELPDKQEQIIYCEMTEKQEQYYVHVLNSIHNEILKDVNANPNYMTMLSALTRLRQICDHPGLINNDFLSEPEMSGKLETLEELVEDAIANNRKILIFSQYLKMLQLVEQMVNRLGVRYEYMDGNSKDRKNIINNFNNNEKIRIFLISLKTGGFGINLTAADTVILVDPWWNPMIETQAVDRVHRMGQTKKVLVYKMITKGSIEEKIILLQKIKKDLFDNIIDKGEMVLKNLDLNDIKTLFEYKK